MSSWDQIAKAYEKGYTLPSAKLKPRRSYGPKRVTIGDESMSLKEWVNDPRNEFCLTTQTLSKRADKPQNLVSVEVFMRPPRGARP